MKELQTTTISNLEDWPKTIAFHQASHWKGLPKIILLLTGELGAGKTTLVRALGRVLKIQENINSPTFNLCNIYETGSVRLLHYDLYRLEGPQELFGLDFEEHWFFQAQNTKSKTEYIAIEWWQRAGKEYFLKFSNNIPIFEYAIELLSEDAQASRKLSLFRL